MNNITKELVIIKKQSPNRPLKWQSNEDLTYSFLIDEDVNGETAVQSKFDGSLFRDSKLNNVDLNRCDLDGSRIENCHFTNVIFRNCDVISLDVSQSSFDCCAFDDACLHDSIFSSCIFRNCTFVNSSTEENVFIDSSFKSCDISQSTTDLNKYIGCEFYDMILGDCSLAYNVLLNCTYNNMKINVDSLGLNYGFSPNNLSQFEFLFLGKNEISSIENIENIIADSFIDRGWFFQYSIFKLNMNKSILLKNIVYIFETILVTMEAGIRLKRKEIDFFISILKVINEQDSLPLAFLVYANDRLNSLPKLKTAPIEQLINVIKIWYMEQLGELVELVQIAYPIQNNIRMEIGFEYQPKERLDDIIGELNMLSHTEGELYFLSSHAGSHIEIYESAVMIITQTTALLILLNGFFKAAKSIVTSVKEFVKSFQLTPNIPKTDALNTILYTTKYLLSSDEHSSISSGDYSAKNIKWIKLVNGSQKDSD